LEHHTNEVEASCGRIYHLPSFIYKANYLQSWPEQIVNKPFCRAYGYFHVDLWVFIVSNVSEEKRRVVEIRKT
jgi:hypothetical protein